MVLYQAKKDKTSLLENYSCYTIYILITLNYAMETLHTIGLEKESEGIEDPRPFILGIINEVSSMGGNDSEVSELYDIFNKFQQKEMTAAEAYRKALDIKERKNAYH